jgi:L-seryl-tRNA(Ser) seleniumtransferase
MSNYRVIPSVEQLRQLASVGPLESAYGHDAVIDALRAEAAAIRHAVRSGRSSPETSDAAAALIVVGAAARLSVTLRPSLTRVLNATGVIIHTNLGRAPLADAARERASRLADGYTNLEYDLEQGSRGARHVHAEPLLCRLTGAEAAVVVNNCAAATLLVLAALARGRDVLVSRSELVEIGGGFRVPDVMAQSGAGLREVGTTNRTRIGDYALAISDKTGAILRVHPSNFRIDGFTARATLGEIVALARRFNLPVVEDLGSGFVSGEGSASGADGRAGTKPAGLAGEPSVQASIQAGVDLVCFSGDKLLGGPQAGIIVGRADALQRVRAHPLMRALRVDKLTYAALEATLIEHLAGRAFQTVPVLRMATTPVEAIAARAELLGDRLRERGYAVDLIDGVSTIGGGSAPGSELPTRLVAIVEPGLSADRLEARLRALDPPIIARIQDDRVVIDLRTIAPEDDEELTELVRQMFSSGASRT